VKIERFCVQASYDLHMRQSECGNQPDSAKDVQHCHSPSKLQHGDHQRRLPDEFPPTSPVTSQHVPPQHQQLKHRTTSASVQPPKTYHSAASASATMARVQPDHRPVKYLVAVPSRRRVAASKTRAK